jgi:hypothetical protein
MFRASTRPEADQPFNANARTGPASQNPLNDWFINQLCKIPDAAS